MSIWQEIQDEEISSPLYATAVGLVMNSIENKTQSAVKLRNNSSRKGYFQARSCI
jgi:hypothetical protein